MGDDRGAGLSVTDKFKLLKDLGTTAWRWIVSIHVPVKEILAAQDATGIPVQGVVNQITGPPPFSDPTSPSARRRWRTA